MPASRAAWIGSPFFTAPERISLRAVAVAALTLYDMVKAVDKTMVIGDIELVEKKGGRSGHYRK